MVSTVEGGGVAPYRKKSKEMRSMDKLMSERYVMICKIEYY